MTYHMWSHSSHTSALLFVTGSTFFLIRSHVSRASRSDGSLSLALKTVFFLAFVFRSFFSFLSLFCFSCYNNKNFHVYTIFDRFLVIYSNKAPQANFLIFEPTIFSLECRWPWLNRQHSEIFRIFFCVCQNSDLPDNISANAFLRDRFFWRFAPKKNKSATGSAICATGCASPASVSYFSSSEVEIRELVT